MVLVVILVAIVARTCLVISGHKAIPFHATEVKHDSVFEGDHDERPIGLPGGGRTAARLRRRRTQLLTPRSGQH